MASQWLGAAPPPDGIEPNFVNPVDHLPQNIALHTVCLTLVTLSVCMRLYTRIRVMKTTLGMDDYCCIISWCLTVTYSSLMLKAYTLGMGRHIWNVPNNWLPHCLKYFNIATYIYTLLTAFIKLTFLLFYYQLFHAKTTIRYLSIFGIVFVSCLNLALFFSTVFECSPINLAWDFAVKGHCINPVILPYLSGVSSSVTDIYVFILPIPVVWKLNMRTERKLRVMAVFSIGLFACVASLVRLGKTPQLRKDPDATWALSDIGIWGTLEVNIGIVCACLMLLPAFLKHSMPEMPSSMSRLLSQFSSRFSTGSSEKRNGSSAGSKESLDHQADQINSNSPLRTV